MPFNPFAGFDGEDFARAQSFAPEAFAPEPLSTMERFRSGMGDWQRTHGTLFQNPFFIKAGDATLDDVEQARTGRQQQPRILAIRRGIGRRRATPIGISGARRVFASTPSGLSRTWITSSVFTEVVSTASVVGVVSCVGVSQPTCQRLKGSGRGGRVPVASPGRASQCSPITLQVSTPAELPSAS